ncbi:MAG: hypothetical protein NZ521_06380, partial [Flammeovirgaceae bacterium]|nr:hypothetical protein [Flammeovirgaceae bacterium]
MKRCVAHFFLFFAGLCSLMAQHPMRYIEGIPYIFNYHSGDYQAEQQNWSVVEDKKGVVYFANGAGVLEFDGSGWRLIRLPNRAGVYSLAMDEEGKIFVGGNNELGYLAADYLGNLHYASLLSKIAPEARNFEEVTHIFTKDEKVFFLTRFTLFVYDRYTISPLKAYTEFVNGFLLDNQLYVQEKKKGLKKWDGEKLIDFYTPSEFLNDPIIAMLPFEKDAYLLITSAQKSYLFRNNTFSPTTFMMQAAIQSGNITTVKVLSNGFYALGTLKKGIFILNRHGRIVYHINKSSGLENDYITYLHEDTHGNLWASLGNGLSYIELNAPFSRINEVNGLLGIPKTACFYRQTLYVGTTQGIFYKTWLPYQDETFTLTQFQPLENSDVRMWHIARIGDELFGLHQNGILLIEGKKATRLYEGEPVWTIIRLQEHADKLLAGTSDGLIVLEKKEKKWQFSHRVQGFSEKINFLLQDSEGNLWISHEAKGLYRLTLSSNLKLIKSMSRYGSHHGLPSMYGNRIFIVHGLLAVGTEKGVYVYQSRNNRFVSYEKINQYFKGLPSIKWIVEEPSGDIWYQAGEVGEYSTKTL